MTATVDKLKGILRETEIPFFSDSELEAQIEIADGDLETAAYNCAILKAENCGLSISGLSIADSYAYWLRVAAMYRPCNTTVVG